MIALEKARAHLEQIAQAAAVRDGRLEMAVQQQMPYADFLADLLSVEAAARRERYLVTRTRLAHLPYQRTLEQFDFSFQPSIDERQVRELATLSFIPNAANILFLGPPGVGKMVCRYGGLRAEQRSPGTDLPPGRSQALRCVRDRQALGKIRARPAWEEAVGLTDR